MTDYAGDITPQEAWDLLTSNPDALLVDVRTQMEWDQIGVPEGPDGREVAFIEWVRAGGVPNPAFVDELLATGVQQGAPIVFLCRSGVRSQGAAAAATQAGYGPAYNVLEGFEGAADALGRREHEGWKIAGLPWHRD